MLRAADVLSEVREAGEFGIRVGEPTVDFDAVMARRGKVVSTLTGGVSGLFKKNKIELVTGAASLTEAGTVRVGDDELEREDDHPRDRLGAARRCPGSSSAAA